jgi:hypothetical protein
MHAIVASNAPVSRIDGLRCILQEVGFDVLTNLRNTLAYCAL